MSSIIPSQGKSLGADGHTQMPQSAGSKRVKVENLSNMSVAADVGQAPPSRVYTKDYSKVQEAKDTDTVTAFLGNPLRW